MSVSPNAQAIVLLTARLGRSKSESAKPLTTKEWNRLVRELKDSSYTPADLLTGNLSKLLGGWSVSDATVKRIDALLNRGAALALHMEKWHRSGIWVMVRSDPDYPRRLKEKLRDGCPPVLFGCGNRRLLAQGQMLAVVGSRKATQNDLNFSRKLGRWAAKSGYSVVSGGAKGVDEAAMQGALEEEGTVVGVLANGLLRASVTAAYRSHLLNGDLALVSPFNPEAGFNVGNAMDRNKYIYCLADAAVVVRSDTRGGTWNGAKDNQEHWQVPLWVKKSDHEGNLRLVENGARWLPSNFDEIDISKLSVTSDTQNENSNAPEQGKLLGI